MQSGLFDLSRQPLRVPTVVTAERAASLRTQEGNHSSRCLRLWNAPPPPPPRPRRGVLMATVGRGDRYRIWCAHPKSQSRCQSNNAAAAWAGASLELLASAVTPLRIPLCANKGKSCGDKRNPNCFLDPQSWWRRRTWIDQEFTQPGKNERKCFDFRFGERMAAFLWVFLDLTSADRCTFSQLPRVNTSIPAWLFLANIWFPLSHAYT